MSEIEAKIRERWTTYVATGFENFQFTSTEYGQLSDLAAHAQKLRHLLSKVNQYFNHHDHIDRCKDCGRDFAREHKPECKILELQAAVDAVLETK